MHQQPHCKNRNTGQGFGHLVPFSQDHASRPQLTKKEKKEEKFTSAHKAHVHQKDRLPVMCALDPGAKHQAK
eukprot:567709-Pelagomonas_calceolata.AAC.1